MAIPTEKAYELLSLPLGKKLKDVDCIWGRYLKLNKCLQRRVQRCHRTELQKVGIQVAPGKIYNHQKYSRSFKSNASRAKNLV